MCFYSLKSNIKKWIGVGICSFQTTNIFKLKRPDENNLKYKKTKMTRTYYHCLKPSHLSIGIRFVYCWLMYSFVFLSAIASCIPLKLRDMNRPLLLVSYHDGAVGNKSSLFSPFLDFWKYLARFPWTYQHGTWRDNRRLRCVVVVCAWHREKYYQPDNCLLKSEIIKFGT